MSTTLLVVAKAPVAGRAKTRLMPMLSAQQAASVAAAALLDTLDAVATTPARRRVVAITGALDAAVAADEVRSSLRRFDVVEQRGTDFGARLVGAHHDAGPGPVFQIGMDTPQVSPGLLAAAAAATERHDAALGFADDGGWWGLGVRDPALARVLRRVPMSRADTGERTLAALRDVGARVALLPTLRDVDTLDDAVAVAAALPGGTGPRFGTVVDALARSAVGA